MKNILLYVFLIIFVKNYSQSNGTNITDNLFIKEDTLTSVVNDLKNKINKSITTNNWKKQVVHLRSLSEIYSEDDDTPRALQTILEAIQVFEKNDSNKHGASIYMIASNNLEKIGAYKEAIIYRKKRYEWFIEKNKGLKKQYSAVDDIAKLYYKIKDYSKSRKYYHKALKISEQINFQHNIAHSNNNIGLTFLNIQKIDSAKVYFKKALILFKNNPKSTDLDSLMVGIVSGNLAECFFNKKEKDKAFSLLNTSIIFCRKYESYNNLVSAYLKLVKFYMILGDLDNAKKYNEFSQNVLNDTPNVSLQLKTYKNFISLYMKSVGNDKTDNFIKKYIGLNDSLYGPKIIEKITATKSVFQLDKINYELQLKQISINKKKVEIQKLKQEEKIMRLNNHLTIGIALLIIAFGVFGYLKIKNDQAKKAELQEIKDQLMKAELKNKKTENRELKGNLEDKDKELTNYAIEISENYQFTKNLKHELNELKKNGQGDSREYTTLLNKVNSQLGIENQLKEFQRKANIIHMNFNEKLAKVNNKLTKNDLYLCGLIRLNLSNKDIAILKNVTEKAVSMNKYRLKKKLLLPKEKDLGNFLKQL
ncbi:MAG: tetratricopeptide repeat protein [Flavobacteriaceae bacterium]|nr:tetratricopeptide repeat protein [Flavobacteriaceae bacterium]